MINKIYIRVDGNSDIGLGHVTRCIALAHMLKVDYEIRFYSKFIPDSICNELFSNGIELKKINDEASFLNAIESRQIVVLDGYKFDTEYQRQIKSRGAKLICIDDLHDKKFYADLIINHAPGVKPENYSAQYYTQFCLGPEYALLRPVFLYSETKKKYVEKIETVLVCFGGADYKNLTESTLKTLLDYSEFKKIIVITGAAYKYIDTLRLLISMDTRVYHFNSVNEQQMHSLLEEADLAIVPASGILIETLTVDCCVISGIYSNDQKIIYSRYKDAGYFIDSVDFNHWSLKGAIKKCFGTNYRIKNIIDGNSGKRILKSINQLYLTDRIVLRKANQFDLEVTYQWANNPKIRAYSFKQKQITKEEHTYWFNSKLKNNRCIYFIANIDNKPIGSIRFDLGGTSAVISYLIDSKYQGKGLGQVILLKGYEELIKKKNNGKIYCKKVVGYVMKNNIPSINAFERLGFVKVDESDKYKFEKSI